MDYRREIDGLRAVAVISIVLFHAGFESFAGGFVGVDVFLVISGYLITSIIVAEKRAGTFSIKRFYERRARRILPAVLLTMLACIPFACLLMLPDDLENFGQSLVATTFFSNNILLWLTSGYWDLSTDFKPLRHTWSLGVEEQFYILFPILIGLVWKLGRKWLPLCLAAGAVLSLLLVYYFYRPASFLLLPTRAWELLLGALVALSIGGRQPAAFATHTREVASVVGVLLIGFAVLVFDKRTLFPGLSALVPTVGAALIIVFAGPRTLVGRILGSAPLVLIGLVSYSLYLWHQPIFAFIRIWSFEPPPSSAYAWGAVASLVCAVVSWRFVERPFRDRALVTRRTVVASFLIAGSVCAAAGWLFYINSGLIPGMSVNVEPASRNLNSAYNMSALKYENAGFTTSSKTKVLVVGDSFARDVINAGEANGYLSDCEISYLESLRYQSDEPVVERARRFIAMSDYVILAKMHNTPGNVERDIRFYRAAGAKKVVVIGTKNFGWNLNAVLRLPVPERFSYRAKVLDDVWEENWAMKERLSPAVFVDVLGILADKDRRVPVFTGQGEIISQDRSHLTRAGAQFVGKLLFAHPLLMNLK